jgi:hypothetical protein
LKNASTSTFSACSAPQHKTARAGNSRISSV